MQMEPKTQRNISSVSFQLATNDTASWKRTPLTRCDSFCPFGFKKYVVLCARAEIGDNINLTVAVRIRSLMHRSTRRFGLVYKNENLILRPLEVLRPMP